ncbi:MAG: hypothetical protein WCS97_03440 [Candidatus Paceibacterota bacterium]|jgi:hypothetical protein
MRKDKEIAFNLRRGGKSYTEIRDALKIPVATLSGWFSEVDWSKQLKKKLASEMQEQHTTRLVELNKIRGQRLKHAYKEATEEAGGEFERMKYNPLFIAGLMLYWGEGDKLTRHLTKLTNIDPNLIRLYVFFLKNVCRIPEGKIKAQLLVYPDLNEENCREYWSRKSGIELKYFTKSSTIQGRHKIRRITHGVCIICISSTYFKVKMLEWLRLLPNELMNKAYYENI